MSINIFFENKGPFKLNFLFPKISNSKNLIKDVKTLSIAGKSDITFFDSPNYQNIAKKNKSRLLYYQGKSCKIFTRNM